MDDFDKYIANVNKNRRKYLDETDDMSIDWVLAFIYIFYMLLAAFLLSNFLVLLV